MGWNYRVVREAYYQSGKLCEKFSIRETFYDDEGRPRSVGESFKAVVWDENKENCLKILRRECEKVLLALDKSVLQADATFDRIEEYKD